LVSFTLHSFLPCKGPRRPRGLKIANQVRSFFYLPPCI
jgi:hypothetical protein